MRITRKGRVVLLLLWVFLGIGIFVAPRFLYAGTLSCTVRASACSGGETAIWRMSGTSNAHAELPSQSLYAQLVCCSGVTGLGTSCTDTFATALKLSGTTNAHAEQNSQSNYTNSACIQAPSGGSVSLAYQSSNCTGYDTTLGSISGTTNAHVGDGNAYTTKVCATAAAGVGTLSFSISDASVGFGTLSTSAVRYATGDTAGSGVEAEAHTISASTSATDGYTISVNGSTLTAGARSIDAIGCSNTASSAGFEQFGMRLAVNSGNGTVTAPYAAAGFALCAAEFPDQIASGAGDGASTVYSARYLANIANTTEPGSYTTSLTFVATASF